MTLRLPHSNEAERAVLGAILLKNSCIELIPDLLPEHFYHKINRACFECILLMRAEEMAIDVIGLKDLFHESPALPPDETAAQWMSELLDAVPTWRNIESHARKIIDLWKLRRLILTGEKLMTDGQLESDADELIQLHLAEILKLQTATSTDGPEHVKPIVSRVYKSIEARRNGKAQDSIRFGFRPLDKLAEMGASDLVVIAGRPSHGKTAFACNVALEAALCSFSAVFFSVEMDKETLTWRFLSLLSGVPVNKFKSSYFSDADLSAVINASARLSPLPLHVDDRSQTLMAITAHVKRMIPKVGVDLVIVDYLQLMAADQGTKDRSLVIQTGNITKGMKLLAKSIKKPVILLSQLSRDCEKRTGKTGLEKRPQLSDLRDSGCIEQDADIVIGIFRPERNGIQSIMFRDQRIDARNLAHVEVLKNRNGETGSVLLKWNGAVNRFSEWEGEFPEYKHEPEKDDNYY